MSLELISIRDPRWRDGIREWTKWRLAFEGGWRFIDTYMQKLSTRESNESLQARKDIAFCPAFAKEAVKEISDAIYQRMVDVVRVGGPQSYTQACAGLLGGVDLRGSSMNTYMGVDVLTELLPMKRVGVLVDNHTDLGVTLADKGDKQPYLTLYTTEAILSKSEYMRGGKKYYRSILLEECVEVLDETTQLPVGESQRYRLMQVTDEGVKVTLYNDKGDDSEVFLLDIPEIPFVIFEIQESLMKDIADYQKALLNLEASDIRYAMTCNFPIYYEFYAPTSEQVNSKPFATPGDTGEGKAKSRNAEVQVGMATGRRFPDGLEAPGFINPDPDTLRVSMEKEEQLKKDIRRLVNLNFILAARQTESANASVQDQQGLDASLSYIGLILQTGEMQIARYWSYFEGDKSSQPEVKYPQNYSLKTDEERQAEAERLDDLMHKLPSDTYKRAIAKQIALITIGHKITLSELQKIYKEIDSSTTLTSDADQIIADHEAGLVSDETASLARGYRTGEVDKAKKDRAERIKLTLEAQGGPQAALGSGAARGAPEFGGVTGSQEKVNKFKRGKGKKITSTDPRQRRDQ